MNGRRLVWVGGWAALHWWSEALDGVLICFENAWAETM